MAAASGRKFVFSAELFGGYTVSVPTTLIVSPDAVVKYCVGQLLNDLQRLNLAELMDALKGRSYHIHDEIGAILSDNNKVFYLCDYKHEPIRPRDRSAEEKARAAEIERV